MTLIYPLVDVDPANLTQGGYDYLEWVGDAFHPGIDLNTPGGAYTDLGTAVAVGAQFLLTGDKRHFGLYYGQTVLDVTILKPAAYLKGRLEISG